MLTLQLATHSNVPTYVQIVQQVRQALLAGVLRPGDRLPTVKDVVTELAINPNTVLKAYRELEREGLVEARQGVGTFARRRPDGPPPAKDVVTELAINPNTVLKAYRELEREGLVEARQGVGTFARRRPDGPPPA